MERLRSFDFDAWRMQYLRWMKNNQSRIMDFFHRQDTDGDGKVTRKEFIEGIIKSRTHVSFSDSDAVVLPAIVEKIFMRHV